MLDLDGRVATWNAGAERIKGYKAEEIIGLHFARFYPPEDQESGKPKPVLEIAVATGKYQEEGWRVRKDGSRFWANVLVTALRDERGTLRGFAKVTRDMTEHQRAEENTRRLLQEEAGRRAAEASAREAQRAQREERRQRNQLHVTLASIGDAVIVTDMQGAVTFLNAVAEALNGLEAARRDRATCGDSLSHRQRGNATTRREPSEQSASARIHHRTGESYGAHRPRRQGDIH